MTPDQTAIAEPIDLKTLGLEDLAYIRPAEMDGVAGFSIHAADGRVIGFAADAPKALGAIKQHEMEAVALH
jgi:hypothetical protein